MATKDFNIGRTDTPNDRKVSFNIPHNANGVSLSEPVLFRVIVTTTALLANSATAIIDASSNTVSIPNIDTVTTGLNAVSQVNSTPNRVSWQVVRIEGCRATDAGTELDEDWVSLPFSYAGQEIKFLENGDLPDGIRITYMGEVNASLVTAGNDIDLEITDSIEERVMQFVTNIGGGVDDSVSILTPDVEGFGSFSEASN